MFNPDLPPKLVILCWTTMERVVQNFRGTYPSYFGITVGERVLLVEMGRYLS